MFFKVTKYLQYIKDMGQPNAKPNEILHRELLSENFTTSIDKELVVSNRDSLADFIKNFQKESGGWEFFIETVIFKEDKCFVEFSALLKSNKQPTKGLNILYMSDDKISHIDEFFYGTTSNK